LVEQRIRNAKVEGSTPFTGTTFKKAQRFKAPGLFLWPRRAAPRKLGMHFDGASF